MNQNELYGTVVMLSGAIVDLIGPLSGIVKEVNKNLEDNQRMINRDLYGEVGL